MPKIWIDTHLDNPILVGTQLLRSLMTGVSATQTRFDRMTLLRTIIGFDVGNIIHDSGEGSQEFHIGIGVASQEAFALGAISDPVTDTDFPTRGWIWRATYRTFGFAADQPTIFTRRVDLDIRAKRKLENGEAFVVADNIDHEGVSSSLQILGLIRQLWDVG